MSGMPMYSSGNGMVDGADYADAGLGAHPIPDGCSIEPSDCRYYYLEDSDDCVCDSCYDDCEVVLDHEYNEVRESDTNFEDDSMHCDRCGDTIYKLID